MLASYIFLTFLTLNSHCILYWLWIVYDMTFTSSQNSSCESHFYSHQVLIRAVRSEELSGQQEPLRLWSFHIIAANYRLMMTQFELLTTTHHCQLILKHMICHQGRMTAEKPNSAQTSKKPFFVKARSGLRTPAAISFLTKQHFIIANRCGYFGNINSANWI